MDRLPTGLYELDRELRGGLRPGTLVALVARPATQSELLLASPAAATGGRWLSVLRPAAEARETVPEGVEVRPSVAKARGDRALPEPLKLRLTDQVTADTSRDI